MRSIFNYVGHPTTNAALKLSPLVFVCPGELRTMEWAELDLDAAEWCIPGSKMKIKVDHRVPLSKQAVELLRDVQPMSGHGRYIFPSLRTGELPMSENTINAAQVLGQAAPLATVLDPIQHGVERLQIGHLDIAALHRQAVRDFLVLGLSELHG